jgi:hypothetical protein
MNNILGITGVARSGKDSFASALVQQGFRRIAFADALKLATALIANEDSHLYFDEFAKEQHTDALGMTRRSALQKVGKAVRDSVGEDTWVNRALNEWRSSGKPDTVISDCRYPNEAIAIRAMGGTIIRINRPGLVGLTGEAAQHESEARLADDLVDVEVYNDGTIGDLHAEARKILATPTLLGAVAE